MSQRGAEREPSVEAELRRGGDRYGTKPRADRTLPTASHRQLQAAVAPGRGWGKVLGLLPSLARPARY